MRYSSLALAAAAVIAAAGCSKAPEQNKAPADVEAPAPAAASETAAPAPEPSASASASASAPAVTAIPEALQGRWGLVPADCTSTKGDAKGLVEIGPRSMKFYESVAKLGAIRSGGADSIDATFAFTGEGQSWTLDVALDAQDGGKTLIRKDTGRDALPGPLKYTRC